MSLEALLDEKGRISRLIGEAKKRGESAEELIARMKLVSSQIGELKKSGGAGLTAEEERVMRSS